MSKSRTIVRRIARMLQKSGQNVHVMTGEGPVATRGVITALQYKNRVYLEENHLLPGMGDVMHYTYFGGVDVRLDLCPAGTVLETENASYILKIAECIRLGEDELAVWAILQKYVAEETEEIG